MTAPETAPTTTTETTAQPAGSNFNTGASVFIPKKKIVKTQDEFPDLDLGAASNTQTKKAAKKGKKTVVQTQEKSSNDDPCRGKPTSFFVMDLTFPDQPFDPIMNPMKATDEQMTFVFTEYVEYSQNPVAILYWLFEMACNQEEQANI